MKRVRLTSRKRKAESQADGLFPGDVGNMERSKNYRKMDEYHKFEQTVNHELPDMRHEWKEDKRDENNIPVPKVASMYAAAQNAIKLSMMLLGDKAPQKTIEAQARDFMKLGNKKLVASMNRWLETEEECEECKEGCDEKVSEEMIEEEQPIAPVAEEEVVEEPIESEEEEVIEEPIESEEEEMVEEPIESEEEEMDIEEETTDLNNEVDFENISEQTVEADEELQAIFDDTEDDENEVIVNKVASKKKGIKKIACQPKRLVVASKKADELEGLWSKLDVPGIN